MFVLSCICLECFVSDAFVYDFVCASIGENKVGVTNDFGVKPEI